MNHPKNRVCPVELSGPLDNRFRKWFQHPRKILSNYLKEGMTVLDIGCGPGFFTIEMARMVGESGRVIAADLQKEMLWKLENKIERTPLEDRIVLHQCASNRIGIEEKVDFALAFYMVHEIPDQDAFFKELATILKPDGKVLIAEPPFHVTRKAFIEMIKTACGTGFKADAGPKILFSKTILLLLKDEDDSL